MKVYNPITTVINGIHVFVYPFEDSVESKFDLDYVVGYAFDKAKEQIPDSTLYAIAMPWKGERLCTDLHFYHDMGRWVNDERWRNANPTVKDLPVIHGIGINRSGNNTCGISLMIRGREEEHRKQSGSYKEYLKNRPTLPETLCNSKDFF